jgi:hypothetical protein
MLTDKGDVFTPFESKSKLLLTNTMSPPRVLHIGRGKGPVMAETGTTPRLPDLTRVAPEERPPAEGEPRLIYTLQVDTDDRRLSCNHLCSYLPSDGSAPRLVTDFRDAGSNRFLGVWDSENGAFLRALPCDSPMLLLAYERHSDGRPRVAVGGCDGCLYDFDGDDYRLLHRFQTNPGQEFPVDNLAVYEDPRSRRTRLVSA